MPQRHPLLGLQTHGRRSIQELDQRARLLVAWRNGKVSEVHCSRAHELGRPAFPPLHFGINGQAEGCHAYHSRLLARRSSDWQVCLRYPRQRQVLLWRWCWLDHWTYVRRIRASSPGCCYRCLRRHSGISQFLAVLGGYRQAPGHSILCSPNSSKIIETSRRFPRQASDEASSSFGIGWRAYRSWGLEVVLWYCGKEWGSYRRCEESIQITICAS